MLKCNILSAFLEKCKGTSRLQVEIPTCSLRSGIYSLLFGCSKLCCVMVLLLLPEGAVTYTVVQLIITAKT